MSRLALSTCALTILFAACGDGPSAVGSRAGAVENPRPTATIGVTTDAGDIADILAAINAAWAAKSAAAYAAQFSEDAQFISPVGGLLSGRVAIQAQHVALFNGPFAQSTQVVTLRRLEYLTGTVAMADLDAVLTGFGGLPPGLRATSEGTVRSRVRWVLTKREGEWQIVAQQLTPLPPA
jgi:uncharacterized protein (TIGR02246 family)